MISWMRKSAQLLLAASALSSTANAVLYGDEIYQDVAGGKFWAFYTEGVAVIDPESCSIETTITNDHNNDLLPNAWNDAVYMQTRDNSKGMVLIGSRVDEQNEKGEAFSHMYAFDTVERKVISKSETGPRSVHSYAVWPRGEFWMHSDGNGLFYVFDVDDLAEATHDNIEAKVEDPSHGKLLWDEGKKLGNRGFGTATGEQYLFEFDMETKEQVMAYDYSVHDIVGCTGLHAIAYSDLNEHIYAECSRGGGALEFDVSGGKIEFVQQFPDANGAFYETPDGKYVVATSKGNNAMYVFVPQGTGNKSSAEYVINMPGGPSTVSFYTTSNDETIACSPLTENLNQNQRREDGSVACDYANKCTGAATATDVAQGVCLHNSDPDLKNKLMRVSDVLQAQSMSEVCARCQDSANFATNEDGESECICTPHCGSCDPNPVLSDAESGYYCVNLDAYTNAQDSGSTPTPPTKIPGTGGMIQGSPYSSSAECTFGRTYRNHKRGGKYDAAVSNVPEHSIVIIDMEKMEKKCSVSLPDAPRKVIYAPDSPVDVDTSAAAARTPFAMVALGAMAVVAAIL